MQLTELPYTIFLEIITYVPPTDILLCRRVSRDLHRALTSHDLCISLILLHFPRSREGHRLRHYVEEDDRDALAVGEDWAVVFARLVRRYFHLGHATPWRRQKLAVLKDDEQQQPHRQLRGVTPWERYLQLNEKKAPFHYRDPVWTCSPAEGLLVYPAAVPESVTGADGGLEAEHRIPEYRARDLESGQEIAVPFDMQGKIIRRVRLSHGILIFEWCEEEAHHPLNDNEAAHRHFATAFDVCQMKGRRNSTFQHTSSINNTETPEATHWAINFRAEWQIHYIGLPLSDQDRFYSTHNRTHYAIYIWQPNRSPWGEDDPLERLIIWELGEPSTFQPSQNTDERSTADESAAGPHIIRRMANGQLCEWAVRQGTTPSLRTLALDECTWDDETQSACGHVFFLEEEHRWSAGTHSSTDIPRLHHVKTTGIPLLSHGPRWIEECGGGGGGGSGNLRFCWRGSRRKRNVDRRSGLSHQHGDNNKNGDDDRDAHVAGAWPGRAPCWRHDDFPYLTVSEVLDSAAGVRISARQCFLLETLSVHVRPKLNIQGVEAFNWITDRCEDGDGKGSFSSATAGLEEDDDDPRDEHSISRARISDGPDGREVQFEDDLWSEMLGKGFICGDERWIIGEDEKGDITVLEF